MAALSVQVPYPVFYDRDGQPLDNGNIYIGVANLDPVTNPIQVYYDEALTIQASQPLKTSGGYVYRNGTPAQLYVNATNFSILVNDSKNTLVYSFPDGTGISPNAAGISFTGFNGQVGTVADLGGADGSDWIGFTPSGVNAVARSAQEKMRETYSSADVGISNVGDQAANFGNLVTNIQSTKQIGYLESGVFSTATTINVNGNSNTLSGFQGLAPERSVINVTANNVNGVQFRGQYLTVSGFTVQYATRQSRANTASAAVLIGDATLAGFSFGTVDRIFVKDAYYGVRFFQTTGVQQNNNFGTLRASNCYGACFDFTSVGSGSTYASLYASNISIPNVLSVARFSEHSGTVGLLNMEHSCVAGIALDLPLSNNFTINSLHCEQLSFMRSGTTLDPVSICGFAQTSGQGVPSVGSWAIDSCHIGALIVTALTTTGSTARAYVNTMGLAHKSTNQSAGIEVGDSIFIEGADTVTSNEYNGAQTVTAIGATESSPGVFTDHWVEFTVAGSPASPADIASGASCITVSRGNTLLSTIPLVVGAGSATSFEIERLYSRDIKVVGATAARRQGMFRFLSGSTLSNLDLKIGEINTNGQRSSASFWLGARTIVGYSRASNVTTLYFARQHNLRANTPLRIYGTADASFSGDVTSTLTYVSPYAISFAQTGADTPLARDTTGRAILRTYAISTVARSGNYATITFTADHGLSLSPVGVGLQINIQAQDSAYTTANELILDVPTSNSIVVRNVGANEATKPDTGAAMLIEGGFSESALTLNNPFGQLLLPDDWTTYQTILPTTTINAGVTTTLATDSVIRATAGRNTVEILSVVGGDPQLIYTAVVSGTQQVQVKATNPTAAPITPATPAVVIYRVNGG